MTDAPRYMSLKTLAETLDVGESTIEAWVWQGKFPAPKRVGPNNTRRWSWSEVQRHIEGEKPVRTEGGITDGTRQARIERNYGGRNPRLLGVERLPKFSV